MDKFEAIVNDDSTATDFVDSGDGNVLVVSLSDYKDLLSEFTKCKEALFAITEKVNNADKVLDNCEACGKEVDLDEVAYDWAFHEVTDGKVEWFICPHCQAGDKNTNITYED
jgi:hypothetical protein